MPEIMRRLHPRGAACRGICVDADGAMLGPDCVLVERTATGFSALDRDEATSLQKCLSGVERDEGWLHRRCERIADALNKGEVALAQIYGLHIPISDLDDWHLTRLALANLTKAGFNPAEPRVPKGDHDGGEWTDGGGGDRPTAGSNDLLTDVAFQGVYHNIVVAQVAAQLRSKGATVITEVDLIERNGVWARADIMAAQPVGGPMLIVEVKTGKKPRYTSPQEDVYPMAQIGGHVFSPYSKIEALGYRAGQWLPPMTFVTVYKQDAKSDPVWWFNAPPF